MISQAPVIFSTALVLGFFAIWGLTHLFYRREIIGLKQEISILKTTCDHFRGLAETAAEKPSALITDKQRQTIQGLSALISEGQEIRYRCPWPTSRTEYTKEREDRWMEEWNAWTGKVDDFLKKEMTLKAITKFGHTTGVEESWSLNSGPTSQCPVFDRQIQNLVDIMERIDQYL